MNTGLLFLVFILTAVLSYCGNLNMIRFTKSRQILDIPNERSSHHTPTPRGGGFIIIVFIIAALTVSQALLPAVPWPNFYVFLLATSMVAAVSWWDDIKPLSIISRLCVHSLCAVLVIMALGYWHTIEVPLLGLLHLGWMGLPLTFLCIVGLTNAYNFMDGIDGLACSQAIIAGFGWLLLGLLFNQPILSIFGLVTAAANLGFLFLNWNPAKIFMGDVGSITLGFILASLPLIDNHHPKVFSISILLVWPFIFDTAYTFFRRLLKREKVLYSHRSHIYQRLVLTGLSHQLVALVYLLFAFIGLLCSLGFAINWERAGYTTLVSITLLCLILYFWLYRRENQSRVPSL